MKFNSSNSNQQQQQQLLQYVPVTSEGPAAAEAPSTQVQRLQEPQQIIWQFGLACDGCGLVESAALRVDWAVD